MKNMNSMQKGFTLIELMIVVAIIAILAAIAIPAYQTYITKTQFTESQTVATGLENDVSLYWTQNSECPVLGTTKGFPAEVSYAGKYVAKGKVNAGSSTAAGKTCDIVMTFKTTKVSKGISGKVATFKGAETGGNFTWACTSDADPKYLPEVCRAP